MGYRNVVKSKTSSVALPRWVSGCYPLPLGFVGLLSVVENHFSHPMTSTDLERGRHGPYTEVVGQGPTLYFPWSPPTGLASLPDLRFVRTDARRKEPN